MGVATDIPLPRALRTLFSRQTQTNKVFPEPRIAWEYLRGLSRQRGELKQHGE